MSDLYVDDLPYGHTRGGRLTQTPGEVLNPALYKLLSSRVGRVLLCNPGQPATRPRAVLGRDGKQQARHIELGEYYRINCPYCDDTRHRLYVNHLWCTKDPFSGERMRHLATCYNENCLHRHYQDFEERVFGWESVASRRRFPSMPLSVPEVVDDGGELPEVSLPGRCTPLAELPPTHRARAYLEGRGLDPVSLSRRWDVRFCEEAVTHGEAEGRIIVPVRLKGRLVGWQGRFVGDRDWKREGVPKYYTMPNFRKRRVLYNYDRAARTRCMVLTEGVSDAWKVGKSGVAMLGKTIAEPQVTLIRDWALGLGKAALLVVMLDPDAREGKSYLKTIESLSDVVSRRRLVEVALPEGVDPGSLARPVLWAQIGEAAAKAGLRLEEFR